MDIINNTTPIQVSVNPRPVIQVSTNPPRVINVITNPIPVKGDDNYQIAVRNGFTGSESEWLESLNSIEWNSTNW